MDPFKYLETISVTETEWSQARGQTNPIANVLQSAAGANAVMGSNMVLAERCSDVEGSKRMMFPCALPTYMLEEL